MIRLSLLGQTSLVASNGSQLRRVLAGDRRLALMSYLALAMPCTRRRDTMLGMFWPEAASDDEARHRLRQLLYVLRNELGEDALLTVGREEIGLNPDAVWCDAVAFQDAIREDDLETAMRLYGGPLCDGLFVSDASGFERWLEDMRERLHDRAVEAAWQLAKRQEAKGEWSDASRWGMQALRLDPDEERLRWLLNLYEKRGDRARALRVFERFERMLAEDFDIGPSAETIEIVDRLRNLSAPQGKERARRSWEMRLLHSASQKAKKE